MIIALMSDFGDRDYYVGAMKGVIASINPNLTMVDITHHIPPQDITAARFNLLNAVPYFPKETVWLVVVDPGVGGSRRAIAVKTAHGFLVGPDNGLFSGVLHRWPAVAAVQLTQSCYWHTTQPSATFHGRDVFAPVAAHLASGVSLEALGESLDPATLVTTSLPPPTRLVGGILGHIQYCDRFGNLISTIPADWLHQQLSEQCARSWHLHVHQYRIPAAHTYSDVPPGSLLALIGSHGWVELAVHCGNAQAQLQLKVTDSVHLWFDTV